MRAKSTLSLSDKLVTRLAPQRLVKQLRNFANLEHFLLSKLQLLVLHKDYPQEDQKIPEYDFENYGPKGPDNLPEFVMRVNPL